MYNNFFYLEFGHQFVHVSKVFCSILSFYIYIQKKSKRGKREERHSCQSECIVDTHIGKHENVCAGIVRSAI